MVKKGKYLICKKNYYGPEYGRSYIITVLILISDISKIYLKKRIFEKNKTYMIMDCKPMGLYNYCAIDNIWFYDDYLSKFFIDKISEERKIKLEKLKLKFK
jgi:hypothetical protein